MIQSQKLTKLTEAWNTFQRISYIALMSSRLYLAPRETYPLINASRVGFLEKYLPGKLMDAVRQT